MPQLNWPMVALVAVLVAGAVVAGYLEQTALAGVIAGLAGLAMQFHNAPKLVRAAKRGGPSPELSDALASEMDRLSRYRDADGNVRRVPPPIPRPSDEPDTDPAKRRP